LHTKLNLEEQQMRRICHSLAIGLLLTLASLTTAAQNTTFNMVRSATAVAAGANCIPEARGRVIINSLGNVEIMVIPLRSALWAFHRLLDQRTIV
jgi:hypothetical protein